MVFYQICYFTKQNARIYTCMVCIKKKILLAVILLTVLIVKKIRTYMDTLHVVTLNYSFFILIFNEVKTLQHRYCNKL